MQIKIDIKLTKNNLKFDDIILLDALDKAIAKSNLLYREQKKKIMNITVNTHKIMATHIHHFDMLKFQKQSLMQILGIYLAIL